MISLTIHRENLRVVRLAREMGCTGTLAVAARFPDERAELEALGCLAYYLYEDTGRDFATHVLATLEPPAGTESTDAGPAAEASADGASARDAGSMPAPGAT